LEYAISASAVARGWSANVVQFIVTLGIETPYWLDNWMIIEGNDFISISPLSCVVIITCTLILVLGAKESSLFNMIITVFNICLIVFIIILGATKVNTDNYTPFFPTGMQGMFVGAGMVFFSYIGFDAVTTLAGEVKNPKRDMPIGIVGTLLIATVLYIGVSVVVNGMVPFNAIDVYAPIASAFSTAGLKWASLIVAAGSITALTATVLASLLGQSRIFYQMAKDGLFFQSFGTVNEKGIPVFGTVATGIVSVILGLFFNINKLTNIISLGTLLAFSMVCGGLIVLRFKQEENSTSEAETSLVPTDAFYARWKPFEGIAKMISGAESIFVILFFIFSAIFGVFMSHYETWRLPPWILIICALPLLACYFFLQILRPLNIPKTFACPLVPLFPLIGVFVNIYLIVQLPLDAIYSTTAWIGIGLVIYFGYGIRKSRLNEYYDTEFDHFFE
jgi:APA family basic amino acid/polyamine antiporter